MSTKAIEQNNEAVTPHCRLKSARYAILKTASKIQGAQFDLDKHFTETLARYFRDGGADAVMRVGQALRASDLDASVPKIKFDGKDEMIALGDAYLVMAHVASYGDAPDALEQRVNVLKTQRYDEYEIPFDQLMDRKKYLESLTDPITAQLPRLHHDLDYYQPQSLLNHLFRLRDPHYKCVHKTLKREFATRYYFDNVEEIDVLKAGEKYFHAYPPQSLAAIDKELADIEMLQNSQENARSVIARHGDIVGAFCLAAMDTADGAPLIKIIASDPKHGGDVRQVFEYRQNLADTKFNLNTVDETILRWLRADTLLKADHDTISNGFNGHSNGFDPEFAAMADAAENLNKLVATDIAKDDRVMRSDAYDVLLTSFESAHKNAEVKLQDRTGKTLDVYTIQDAVTAATAEKNPFALGYQHG